MRTGIVLSVSVWTELIRHGKIHKSIYRISEHEENLKQKHGSEHSKVKLDVNESDLPLVHQNPPKCNYFSAASHGRKGFQMESGGIGTVLQPHSL